MDTTGDTLSFLLYMLSIPGNHKYQDLIRKTLPALPPSHIPLTTREIMAIMSNPYVNSVVKETLLIFPAIPVTLPRVVPQGGRTVDGFKLPAGTLASSTVQAVNYSLVDGNILEIPETGRWKPERWLAEPGGANDEKLQELERRLWSFGSGGRGKASHSRQL